MTKEPFRVEPSVWEKKFGWNCDIKFVGDSLIAGARGGVIHVWKVWSRKYHPLNIPLKIRYIWACDITSLIFRKRPWSINLTVTVLIIRINTCLNVVVFAYKGNIRVR